MSKIDELTKELRAEAIRDGFSSDLIKRAYQEGMEEGLRYIGRLLEVMEGYEYNDEFHFDESNFNFLFEKAYEVQQEAKKGMKS